MVVDEEARVDGDITLRHDAPIKKQRYNGLEDWVIAGGLKKSKPASVVTDTQLGITSAMFGKSGKNRVIINHDPFKVEFKRDGETQIIMNEGGLMNLEHWRPKVDEKKDEAENKSKSDGEQSEDDLKWWEETFGRRYGFETERS